MVNTNNEQICYVKSLFFNINLNLPSFMLETHNNFINRIRAQLDYMYKLAYR